MRGLMSARWIVGFLTILLLTGCSQGARRGQGDQSLLPALEKAAAAAGTLGEQASRGEPAQIRAAYAQFTDALGQVLGPFSLENPKVAQRMANANSRIQELLKADQIDRAALAAQMKELRAGLTEAVAAQAKAKALGVARSDSSGAKTIEITAREHRFDPPRIEVAKGTKVTIRFINKGTTEHEFELDDLGLKIKPIGPGKVAELTFVADRAGDFRFVCDLKDHEQKGMVGQLVVR